ncbi:hypothetical protein, unlikely [Trypanosoma brucei gambiense DAL972]|uniref:Uncharacterized protein n=1 Tax=Trypanosoma brucei gambiense (strain MHOM/CI/86/DAL972) TaxID=679716 RepID=D0A3E9_TRYB9|nr:hypothetical protein, unlikely [Trypanosoma brucei gambiense DAL972]CBH15793.1 hypothetical protein, unlikely [Trypanosoma brucei gambiense DAL972]|eukprot:XP_011778057.1 hypothetical protein, unlikely [Trypanosoma brucei gambiense DAL972]
MKKKQQPNIGATISFPFTLYTGFTTQRPLIFSRLSFSKKKNKTRETKNCLFAVSPFHHRNYVNNVFRINANTSEGERRIQNGNKFATAALIEGIFLSPTT